MRPTTLSKFEISVLQPLVNLGIITENAANHGVAAIVAAPEHIGALLVQRGMMRASHKIICALDFHNRFYGLDKLTRLQSSPIGADGYEIMLSTNRSSIELLNEIRVLTSFLRSNNAFAEIRWAFNPTKRTESEVTEILKHLAAHPPAAIRIESTLSDKPTTKDILNLISLVRKHTNAPIKISGVSQELVTSLLGNRDIKAFDIPDSKLIETSAFIQKLSAFPAAKKSINQFTVEDFDLVLINLAKQDPETISAGQLSEYISRCKVLGPNAVKHATFLEDLLLVKELGASTPPAEAKEVT
jgi:hypothetical protein